MIKRLFLFLILFQITINAQTEYVEINNPVYSFLERMEIQHIISGYNEFEIPKTRYEIGKLLIEINKSKDLLIEQDLRQLEDLTVEFDLEYHGKIVNSSSLFGGGYNLFSEKSKYLFMDTGEQGNIFISLLGEGEVISSSNMPDDDFKSAFLFKMGGQIRGTLLNKFGFSIKGTNGKAFGDKKTALLKPQLRYNLKFNENDENFFDETEGYLTADFELVRFKIGRDRMIIGPGILNPIVGSLSPNFDYLYLNINYSLLSFTYFHGKLLGEIIPQSDPVTGGSVRIVEKYIGYHRINFNFSRHFNLGAGEMIVYGDRPPDLTYMNPFNFYKSVEHANRDRDNSLLFFDFTNNSFEKLKLYTLFLIDDLSFKKINTGWWGNQFLLNAGILAVNINNIPLDIRLEYLRIEPYTFSHRLSRNSYTNYNYPIGSYAEPNSELYFSRLDYRFTARLHAAVEFSYYVHGANPLNPDGSIKENVGGNILVGHRTNDSIEAPFLAGEREYIRKTSAIITFEPVNQIMFSLRINYITESLQNELSQKSIESFINLSIKM